MATLTSLLPQPKNLYAPPDPDDLPERPAPAVAAPRKEPPPYGKRQGFIPRSEADFGDGGAFPEIHVAQYPLDMGRKTNRAASTALVPVQVDQATGKIRYDALITKGANKIVHSQYKDLVPVAGLTEEDLARPDADAEKETTEKTRAALERLINGKLSAAQPAASVEKSKESFVRYTPAGGALSAAGAPAKQRIIRLVETASDPMEPPKHKHKKTVRGPPSPPVPVMRSPPRKVTVKDQQEWKIPPCVSNWKNSKGFTIPLDKRLAADGRGLQETVINDTFAKLSEALYIAERNAREEVEKRNQITQRLVMMEKEKKDEMMRKIAAEARQERVQIQKLEEVVMEKAVEETPEEVEARLKRDQIRDERRRDREREMRLERAGRRQGKATRDEDRDVSERIALGMKAPQQSAETMYDQRLFNQSQGMDSGFANDEAYNLYDKPLFSGGSASQVYRPKRAGEGGIADDEEPAPPADAKEARAAAAAARSSTDTSRFRPDKAFAGADGKRTDGPRSRPVEFEKDEAAADPFGLDEFLKDAKSGKGAGGGGGGGGDKRRSGGGSSRRDDDSPDAKRSRR